MAIAECQQDSSVFQFKGEASLTGLGGDGLAAGGGVFQDGADQRAAGDATYRDRHASLGQYKLVVGLEHVQDDVLHRRGDHAANVADRPGDHLVGQ